MKSGFVAMICRTLIVSLIFVSFHSTAGMIGTDAVVVTSAPTDRAHIQSVLSRAEVATQLAALGVDVKMVHERVALLSDEEARSLAGNLESVPAGADGWGWVVLIAVVALIAWWWWGRRR